MNSIVRPCLEDAAAQVGLAGAPASQESAPVVKLPVRATHRTIEVLRAIASAPRSSNRQIAEIAGLADEGQTSKLLGRLERQGVIENVGFGSARGEPNAWLLTGSGRRAVELINETFASGAPRQRRARMREAP